MFWINVWTIFSENKNKKKSINLNEKKNRLLEMMMFASKF